LHLPQAKWVRMDSCYDSAQQLISVPEPS